MDIPQRLHPITTPIENNQAKIDPRSVRVDHCMSAGFAPILRNKHVNCSGATFRRCACGALEISVINKSRTNMDSRSVCDDHRRQGPSLYCTMNCSRGSGATSSRCVRVHPKFQPMVITEQNWINAQCMTTIAGRVCL